MTTTLARSRVHAGVREGGQFATQAKGEAGVALVPPAAGRHYVYIEREDSPNLAIGPYPSMDAAVLAMNDASMVQGLLEDDEGGIECWADDDKVLAQAGDDFKRIEPDLNDPDQTGDYGTSGSTPTDQLPAAEPQAQVRIEDPEDVFSPPLYEGPAAGAGRVLAGGLYRAVDAEDPFTEYAVRVD